MQTNDVHDPLPIALDHVARACIDENLLEEAEVLRAFLELAGTAPRTVALLHIWIRSQHGDLREALRGCNALIETEPDAPEILSLLAVLNYACGEPIWRSACERLLELPDGAPECRQLALSLLDGSFGRKKQQVFKAANAPEPGTEKPDEAAAEPFDFALHAGFMRG